MIASDWITAHRINLGIYTCTTPRVFLWSWRLLDIVTLTRGIECDIHDWIDLHYTVILVQVQHLPEGPEGSGLSLYSSVYLGNHRRSLIASWKYLCILANTFGYPCPFHRKIKSQFFFFFFSFWTPLPNETGAQQPGLVG